MSILLISPPFVQLNSPYSALPFLIGSLKANGIDCSGYDLGIKIAGKLFSKSGLELLYDTVRTCGKFKSDDIDFFMAYKNDYIKTIGHVVSFLKGKNPNLAIKIINPDYLPVWKMSQTAFECNIDQFGTTDYARYLASLYLEDIFLFYKAVCPDYELSRYGEKLAVSPPFFDKLYKSVIDNNDIISGMIADELIHSEFTDHEIIALTVPFPGTLLGALKTAKFIKEKFPDKIIVLGGGYVNTELRSLKDPKIFDFVDYICLDDGEIPLIRINELMLKKITEKEFVRTFYLDKGKVHFSDNSDIKISIIRGTPDYSDLDMNDYIPVLESVNPMMRLWSEKDTLKLRLARGCYWHKCTFCDTTLPYIKDFSMENVNDIINDIKTMTAQTGLNTFYFTDEAIPPAMAVKLSIALIKENIDISWWGNIRFDYAFTEDVCKLLHRAGCIAVVGGLESACNITLNKMNKGIKIEEAVQVMSNFKSNGILVHSYMIYGFPGESRLDLIDSTEVLRQLFAEGLIDSAFWHRFALTRHSGVFKDPAKYNISIPNSDLKPFANNDISYIDNSNENIDDMGDGLRRSVYNFMLGIEIDKDIKTWFEVPVQKPRVKKNFVKDILNNNIFDLRSDRKILWLGFGSKASASGILVINGINGIIEYELPVELSNWLSELFRKSSIFSSDGISIKEAGNSFPKNAGLVFSDFINNEIWDDLKDSGLIII